MLGVPLLHRFGAALRFRSECTTQDHPFEGPRRLGDGNVPCSETTGGKTRGGATIRGVTTGDEAPRGAGIRKTSVHAVVVPVIPTPPLRHERTEIVGAGQDDPHRRGFGQTRGDRAHRGKSGLVTQQCDAVRLGERSKGPGAEYAGTDLSAGAHMQGPRSGGTGGLVEIEADIDRMPFL